MLARRGARIDDEALRCFVMGLIRDFGGSDLSSRVRVECSSNVVSVETDSDALALVHGALFFCGEYRSMKCKFERVDV